MPENRSDLSRTYHNYLAPEAVVWLNGTKLTELGVFFTELKVEQNIDGADTFAFTISDAIDLEFEPRHAALFRFGDTVEIHFGYADSAGSRATLPVHFRGIITTVNWNFGEERYLDISVEGQDYSYLLMKHKYVQGGSGGGGNEPSWNDRRADEIVREIVTATYSSIFRSLSIESTQTRYKQARHQEENDYLYIRSLAEKSGFEFFVDGDTLYFRPPPASQQSAVMLRYGREILGFTPEFNADKEVTKVRVIGIELSGDKKRVVGEASMPDAGAAGNDDGTSIRGLLKNVNAIEYEVKAPVKSVEEANERAKAILQQFASNLFKGEIRSVGIPELKAGITITLEGLGRRFSRSYYVEKARHVFGEQGYETVLNVRGSAYALKASQ